MTDRTYILPLWLRLWHWSNALLMLLLMISGAALHFTDSPVPILPFELARTVHNVAGIVLAVLYALFLLWNAQTGNWRQYLPDLGNLADNINRQNAFVASGIFKGEQPPVLPTPELKYNALQQITYLLVMYGAMPILTITGIAFFFPELVPETLFGFYGLVPIAVGHYVIGFLLSMFMLGHIYMGTMGITASAGFKMMITGWHEHPPHPLNKDK
ncbi:cytochrome b/b6 domain-containing protein [Magnetospira sp. QH-2]|uniref:cytochrome b/b6 domain-containing protein n=1 Tax=Magnetospira sp. (strain QH-2) TaxID=1288970 RepID=UPI0003E81391|nr:cytochrome b/b6 domain-containing protein [Magnetospira sp. QH-2]CCQ73592.1 Transmembrane di-heme cytochromes [Magnetospira sp. QH-2]